MSLFNNKSSRELTWKRVSPVVYRLIVWALLFAFIYLLRSFFLLIFLTFVFAFIQSSAVARLERVIKSRAPRVIFVALIFFAFLVSCVIFLVPQTVRQSKIFINQYSSYAHLIDSHLSDLGKDYPIIDDIIPNLKNYRNMENTIRKDDAAQKNDHNKPEQSAVNNERPPFPDISRQVPSPTLSLIRELFFSSGKDKFREDPFMNSGRVRTIGLHITGITSSILLAMLFSFLILLDQPNLKRMVRELENTRLGFIYVEVSDTIRDFSIVLGKALEAQFFIAIINSVLTSIGIYFLGLKGSIIFLSVIIFFCSFIPVIGVVISSIPICLLALQNSGINGVLFSVILIIIIHLIEGYVLNPAIYGSHLRINPVLVLIILIISGKLFHIWGLVLGVPVCTYIFGYAIRYIHKPEKPENKSPDEKPLQT